ncbi:hypothetical protein BH18ACT11_BH18ACT11_27800 [soil metagenome]
MSLEENDGIHLSVSPLVEAGVLRSKFTINWKKDRGKNPDGSERHNDPHPSPQSMNQDGKEEHLKAAIKKAKRILDAKH